MHLSSKCHFTENLKVKITQTFSKFSEDPWRIPGETLGKLLLIVSSISTNEYEYKILDENFQQKYF